MNIVDWFDPFNIEHIKAFSHLEQTGFWPEDFLPEDIEVLPYWVLSLNRKMANIWVQFIENGNIDLDSIRK